MKRFAFLIDDTSYLRHLYIKHSSFPLYLSTSFVKKENLIQTPGEPREQHLGEV